MNKLDLKTAVMQIKRACETHAQRAAGRPFFFLVGAGISHPSVPLASEIEDQCKSVAASYYNPPGPTGTERIDTYSHWFEKAYPQPIDRQSYLQGLIENKPITHANLRLAHLLLDRTIASLVVTTNFDDFLPRALAVFGKPHIVCDSPLTVQRIDPEREAVQIVHVHGSYWFYDCCNLRGEIEGRAQASPHTTQTTASFLDNCLSRRNADCKAVSVSICIGSAIEPPMRIRCRLGYRIILMCISLFRRSNWPRPLLR